MTGSEARRVAFESEHERRFLVTEPQVLDGLTGYKIQQAYFWSAGGYAVRVRRQQGLDDEREVLEGPAFLTVKGPREGFTRWEQEIEIPVHRAAAMIDQATHKIEKTRYPVISEDNTWEVDVFHGSNLGLIIAEFEGSFRDVAKAHNPWWCGEEVTQDHRYNNENLASKPWLSWD